MENQSEVQKPAALERKRFLSLVGKSLLGLWLLQLLPANLTGLKLLRPGGMLATFSCSGAIGAPLFQKIVADAAADAGVDLRILDRLGAGADHPMLASFPEGEYLKGLWLQRI